MNQNKHLQALLGDNPSLQQAAQSREAQALMHMLQQDRNPDELQQAAQKAAVGDPAELTALIRGIMQQPEGAKLLQDLSRKFGK